MKFNDAKKQSAIFAATLDPITLEHERAIGLYSQIFEPLYVFVAINPDKNTMFSKEQRQTMVDIAMRKFINLGYNIIVKSIDKLISSEAKDLGVQFLVRGFRDTSDFQYELNLSNINRRLNSELNTIGLFPVFPEVSSTLVRDLIKRNDIRWKQFVSSEVASHVEEIRKT
jgi:pantetheine-phosphate adenylyltransferase